MTARGPRIARTVRSTSPRLSKGRGKSFSSCHRLGDRKTCRIPHSDVAQQIRKNSDLVMPGGHQEMVCVDESLTVVIVPLVCTLHIELITE